MTEEWRPVLEGEWYEVSNIGRVRSWKNNRWGRMQEPRILSGWPSGRDGYTYYSVGDPHPKRGHTLVALAFLGPKPTPRHQVAHKNGVGSDNRVENLRWSLPVENAADRRAHGTDHKYSKRKLTAEQIKEIRTMWGTGEYSQRELAERYPVTATTVGHIVSGKTYRDV